MRELQGEDVRLLSVFLRFWLPVLGYVTLIFAVSSVSHLPGPRHIPYLDKIAHFVEYGILGMLVGRAFRYSGPDSLRKFWFALAVIAAAAVGFLDEWLQGTVPGRERSGIDLVADVLGIVCGQFALLKVESRWRRKKREERSNR